MKNNRKGFTLAELLIVVAIIAVLVAIAIPVFTAQLEKARQATDAANIRAAYAEAVVKILDEGTETGTATTAAKMQRTQDWLASYNDVTIGKTPIINCEVKGATVTVTVNASGDVTFA